MRIFIFTTVFAPSVGGIERLTGLLAREFAALGHDVCVATLTPGPENGFGYTVVRQPSPRRLLALSRWCNVQMHMNISLKYAFPLLVGRRFVVSHQNQYVGDNPMFSVRDVLKAYLARKTHGIACSRYIADRLGCEQVIGNPYDDQLFRRTTALSARPRDLVFLGRLVSSKGCDTLITALSHLGRQGRFPTCTIIGDGPERDHLERLAASLERLGQVRFTGALHGEAIAGELNRHRVLVVPSRYREPFGIVALEGLGCGCLPVVAREGGLMEACGGHGVAFRNGDSEDLARVLGNVLRDPELPARMLAGVEEHLERHTSRATALRFLRAFETVAGARPA